jgi:Tol biopolymer transport system component
VHAGGSGLHEIRVPGQPPCGGALSDPTARGCLDPHWSPDGRRIVFQMISGDVSNIYTVGADGTGLTQVTRGGSDNFPDWGVHPSAR